MSTKITKIGITSNKISGRGGLPLFLRYAERIGLYGLITGNISSQISGNRKGLQLQQFIKQIIAFFIDGHSSYSISKYIQKETYWFCCQDNLKSKEHCIECHESHLRRYKYWRVMEPVSVTTENTACIRQRNTYIRIVTHSGIGKGMPIRVKNDTKMQGTMKKYPKNHRKKLFLDSCP